MATQVEKIEQAEAQMKDMLTCEQASEINGIPARTIRTWCMTGHVNAIKLPPNTKGVWYVTKYTAKTMKRPKRGAPVRD